MDTTLSTHQIQRGIVDLHGIKTAGLEADFREYLAGCFDAFNQRQNERTNGDLFYADVLGDSLAGMLGIDRAPCRAQAKNYLEGSRAIIVLQALREVAEKLPKKAVKHCSTLTTLSTKNVANCQQNAPVNLSQISDTPIIEQGGVIL